MLLTYGVDGVSGVENRCFGLATQIGPTHAIYEGVILRDHFRTVS